jgi:hypothetical protein
MLLKTDNNFLWIELIADKDICALKSKCYAGVVILQRVRGFEKEGGLQKIKNE